MSALCKMNGCLVLMFTTTPPEGGTGKCPLCYGTEFRDTQDGWVECASTGRFVKPFSGRVVYRDECDFAILKAHLDRLPDDVEVGIGAGI